MEKRKVSMGMLLFMLFFAFGCTTVKIINVNKENDFSLTAYKSYDFYKVDIDTTTFPEFNKRIFWLEDELMKKLEINGLKRTSDKPELLINIGIVIEKKIQTRETDLYTDAHYMGSRNYTWESVEVPVGEYHEGTFTIDFVDAKDNALKCMAVSEGVIVKKDKNSKQNIEIAVEKLFKNINKK